MVLVILRITKKLKLQEECVEYILLYMHAAVINGSTLITAASSSLLDAP